jgi:squalene-hopene/tetraprenyl-beta-curcumene cyclase
MTIAWRGLSALGASLVAGALAAPVHCESGAAASWNREAAASYLDQRARWWMAWPTAARDHETFCVSCHTAVPYALSRAALRRVEEALSVNERLILDNVKKRVRLGQGVGPFYNDERHGPHKTVESRGTEAVLNALILARYDAMAGELSDDTRAAFTNMWALQLTTGEDKGAWPWLRFGLAPWEADGSQYYGAALAAVAAGTAPAGYRASPEVQANLGLLREYLVRESAAQPAINRMVLLWASAKLPGLLEREQQTSLIDEALSKQQADGGWSLSSMMGAWKRADGTPLEGKSDGYATGLITLALQQVGIPRPNVHVEQGLSWLVKNQDQAEGFWPAYSLNKRRDPASTIGRFMSDAATAYSVLALTEASP